MSEKHEKKVYIVEFKREALGLLETGGKSGAEIAQELGFSDGKFCIWRKQLAKQGLMAFVGEGHQTLVEEELHQRRSGVDRLRIEPNILPVCNSSSKKAIAIFNYSPDQR